MKALRCEICGSTDLVKKDGLYVCQHCGTKYTPEEAKKLLVEITGDTRQQDGKLFEEAQKCIEAGDFGTAEEYCRRLIISFPEDWRPLFYLEYCQAAVCRPEEVSRYIDVVNNAALMAVTKFLPGAASPEKGEAFMRIAKYLTSLYTSYDADARKRYLQTETSAQALREFGKIHYSAYSSLYSLGKTFEDYGAGDRVCIEAAVLCWKTCNTLIKDNMQYFSSDRKASVTNYNSAAQYIRKYSDPDYPLLSTGGCYIATAVYGSYDCPQVWILRRYRDEALAVTWHGRAFIRLYYALSPSLVRWFGNTEWFRRAWKRRLDRMAERLEGRGFASTPYQDTELTEKQNRIADERRPVCRTLLRKIIRRFFMKSGWPIIRKL